MPSSTLCSHGTPWLTFFPFLSAAFPFPLSSLPPPSGTGVAAAGETGRAGKDRLWVSLSTCT